ncbi:MAG: hypothetical protein KY456_15655 [Chloroflexi bacterium]|nr:hypothetical protein [Chloroflexota bacterium]
MPPQPQGQAAPEQGHAGRQERRISGRAQRKVAAEQAARRKRLTIVGGAIAAALIVALVAFLATRPREAGPPVLAAEPMSDAIPVVGMAMGPEDAPVTVVEWGDYT